MTPDQVTTGSGRKVWWRCDKGRDHQWQASIHARARVGTGCPFCTGNRPSSTNRLSKDAPRLARLWHPTKNGVLRPYDVTGFADRSVWWKCLKGPDHEWQAAVSHMRRNGSCPFCRGRRVSVTNSLAHCRPDLAVEWHTKKNGALSSADVRPTSRRNVTWQCAVSKQHLWRTTVYHRAIEGTGCPFCARKKLAPSTSLAARFPDIAKQWHPTKNGSLLPTQIFPGTVKRIWWRCDRGPDHEWEVSPNSRTCPKSGRGCPFCSGKRVSVTNALANIFPKLIAEWHPGLNGELTPHTITYGSNREVWWKCQFGHVWKQRIVVRTTLHRGCPICAKGRKHKVATTGRRREQVRMAAYEGRRRRPVIRR